MALTLPRQRWVEPIASFVRDHADQTPRWAIVCTYECNFRVLESYLLPALSKRGRQFRTIVLADAGALEQQLSRPPAGQVNIHPVRVDRRGVFHPKLVLLRAGTKIRICVGSANVSPGGYGGNLEMWTSTDESEIAAGVADFLASLPRANGVRVDPVAARQLRRALLGVRAQSSPRVWSSLSESFAQRMRGTSPAAKLTVVSPAYASAGGIGLARRVFPQRVATVFTSDPVKIPEAHTRVYEPPARGEDGVGEDDVYPQTLHAKLYLLQHGERAEAWIGSANFTAKALIRRPGSGGNVECLVRSEVPPDEVHVLQKELGDLFVQPATLRSAQSLITEPIAVARSDVTGCELSEDSNGLRLVVYALPGIKAVTLEHSFEGRRYRAHIALRRRRGVLLGLRLKRAFPELSIQAHVPVLLSQIAKGERIPLVVNIPFVPEEEGQGLAEAHLDTFVDELRGRLPKVKVALGRSDGDEDGDAEGEENEPDDDQRQLDEANHQGILDRIAVKAVLARKLIRRAAAQDEMRDALMREALNVSLRACPQRARAELRRWFSRE